MWTHQTLVPSGWVFTQPSGTGFDEPTQTSDAVMVPQTQSSFPLIEPIKPIRQISFETVNNDLTACSYFAKTSS